MTGGLTERGLRMHHRHGPPRVRSRCGCCGISELSLGREVISISAGLYIGTGTIRGVVWFTVVVRQPRPEGPQYVVTCGSHYCREVAAQGRCS